MIDLRGQRVGTFIVIERAPSRSGNPRKNRRAYWAVRCESCGLEYVVRTDNLRRGAVTCKCQGPTCLRPRAVSPGVTGARYTDVRGYVRVWAPWHDNSDAQGWILEHRLVMALSLGRLLFEREVVHHVNGNRQDNRRENLMLFDDDQAHDAYEREHGWPTGETQAADNF